MTVTVYKARVEDGSVVVDWQIVGSLEQLAESLNDGWVTSEPVAHAAALATGPADVVAPVAAVEPEPDAPAESEDAAFDAPAPKPTARKKK
jgi:hypothetical protein